MAILNRENSIKELVQHNVLELVDKRYDCRASVVPFNHTSKGSLDSKLSHSIRHVSLRVTRRSLINLYNSTKSYTTRNVISLLYRLGVGLPRDLHKADFWKHQSYGGCKCVSYPEYREQLRQDIIQTKDGFLYSKDVHKKEKLLDLIPDLTGAEKCAVIYKTTVGGQKLNDVIACGEHLIFDVSHRHLGIKNVLPFEVPDVKYVVQLGHLKKRDDTVKSIKKLVRNIVNDPFLSQSEIDEQTKRLKFVQSNTVVISYKGKVIQYELSNANHNRKKA